MHATATQGIEELTNEQCWTYLAANDFGRLAVAGEDGVDVFPVNYSTRGSSVFFRSAPGQKLVDLSAHPAVAFEIDGIDGSQRWSVVLRAEARRLGSDAEIEASGIMGLHTLTPTDKWNYVEISPRVVTGRRFAVAT